MPPFMIEEDVVGGLFGNYFMDEAIANNANEEDSAQSSEHLSVVSRRSELPEDLIDQASDAALVADMDNDAIGHGVGHPSPSVTPAKTPGRRSPRSARAASAHASGSIASAESSGRKRKAAALNGDAEAGPTPSKRRSAPRAVTSARPAANAASKPTRGRPKEQTSTGTVKAPRKRGRPKKHDTDGDVPAGEYEVEEIVESAIDADTMEHMYRVKWKGYPLAEATWEPKKNLEHAADLVRKFDATTKKSRTNRSAGDEEKKERKKPGRKTKAKA